MEVEGGGSDDVDLLSGWAGRSRPSNFDGLVRLESRAAVYLTGVGPERRYLESSHKDGMKWKGIRRSHSGMQIRTLFERVQALVLLL
jgi:hypothetical protein